MTCDLSDILGEPGIIGFARLRAIKAVEDQTTPEHIRHEKALELWKSPTGQDEWRRHLIVAEDPSTDRDIALGAIWWLSRRRCCELHDAQIWRAKIALENRDNAQEGA